MREKPFMNIESEFDPSLVSIVKKYSHEDAKWYMENGFREIAERYSDLELPEQDIIEAWKKVEKGVNVMAGLAEMFDESATDGPMQLEQLSRFDDSGDLKEYLGLRDIVKKLMDAYNAAKDTLVAHYGAIASAAVQIAGTSDVHAELEKRDFRKKVYKTVFPTLEKGLAALKEVQGKLDQAGDSYRSYLLFMQTNPLFSSMFDINEFETEPLGRRRSFAEECKKFMQEKLTEMYRENE